MCGRVGRRGDNVLRRHGTVSRVHSQGLRSVISSAGRVWVPFVSNPWPQPSHQQESVWGPRRTSVVATTCAATRGASHPRSRSTAAILKFLLILSLNLRLRAESRGTREHGPEQKGRTRTKEATPLLATHSPLTLATPHAENPSVPAMGWRSAGRRAPPTTKGCLHGTATPRQATPAPPTSLA